MKRFGKSILAAVLVACLLVGFWPAGALAAEKSTQIAGSTTMAAANAVPLDTCVTTTITKGKTYYYKIPVQIQPGQMLCVSRSGDAYMDFVTQEDGDGGDWRLSSGWDDNTNTHYEYCQSNVARTFYLTLSTNGSAASALETSFTVCVLDNDENEPNGSIKTATAVTPGEKLHSILLCNDDDYFAVTTTKPGQFIQLQATSAQQNVLSYTLLDADGNTVRKGNFYEGSGKTMLLTQQAGTYYLKLSGETSGWLSAVDVHFTVTLIDNDKHEPNNSAQTATLLHDGEEVSFTVSGSDADYFKVETTKPGQDIAVTISGFNYSNRGEAIRFWVTIGENTDLVEVDENRTLHLHAPEEGTYSFKLDSYEDNEALVTRKLRVQVLPGDENEPNETAQTATPLRVGMDMAFTVGGYGDEDWFSFEAVPGENGVQLYTLNFLGLNTDYSDWLCYEVYAPDGTQIVEKTAVTVRHIRSISCDQQGVYKVRVYAPELDRTYTRSELRICVDEGGDDPYENNDTWLQAAQIVPNVTISHVLSSAADEDWFCFSVPEDDMTLQLNGSMDTAYQLFSAEALESGKAYQTDWGDWAGGLDNGSIGKNSTKRYKFTDAGLYYVRLTAMTSNTSAEVRTTTLMLHPAADEENNDYWKRATPLYASIAQTFTISAPNDVDWFKIKVPEENTRLYFSVEDSETSMSLYSEADFLGTAGDAASALESWSYTTTYLTRALPSGTYYLKIWDLYSVCGQQNTLWYALIPGTAYSLETAQPLSAGQWAEFYGDGYFALGERKAGEQVRLLVTGGAEHTRGWECYLLDSSGTTLKRTYGMSGGWAADIEADGTYYLYVKDDDCLQFDDNGDVCANRLRYDLATGTGTATGLECVDSITLYEGDAAALDVRATPYTAKTSSGSWFSWNYVDDADEIFDYDDGSLHAQKAGSGTLKLYLRGNSAVSREVTVTVLARDTIPAQSVRIDGAPKTMEVGACADLTAVLTPENATQRAVWESSDTTVLHVAAGGRITAVGCGSATVRVTVGNVTAETETITVTGASDDANTITGLTLSTYSLTLYLGEPAVSLTATLRPAASTAKVSWKSSNTDVATVTQTGQVAAIKAGTSVITASAGDRRVSCIVTVLPARVRVTGVTLDVAQLNLPVGGTYTLTATLAPLDATTRTVLWTSDVEDVAVVSRTGIVTALCVGETVVRVTTVDGEKTAEVRVTVTARAQLGDVNKDGTVDSADAMLCLRAAVGALTLTQEQKTAADVNHDGFVDAGDAVKILRYDARLIDQLT